MTERLNAGEQYWRQLERKTGKSHFLFLSHDLLLYVEIFSYFCAEATLPLPQS